MTKWFPSVIAFANLIAPAVSPTVMAFWSHHAALAVAVGSVAAIVNHFLPSPFAAK